MNIYLYIKKYNPHTSESETQKLLLYIDRDAPFPALIEPQQTKIMLP